MRKYFYNSLNNTTMKKEYQRFGPEWEAEMMKMTKKDLIGFIRRQGQKLDYCIPIRKCKNGEIYMAQRHAEIANEKSETLALLDTTIPTGLTYISITKGRNKGSRFVASSPHLKQVVERLYKDPIPEFIEPENFK